MSASTIDGVRNGIGRNRAKVLEVLALVALSLAVLIVAYVCDIFGSPDGLREARIEVDEILAVATLVSAGMGLFAWRRLQEARRETDRRVAAEREARTLAFRDPLTGLANRRLFDETLSMAAAKPPGSGACHAVIMMDLNGFKSVNDVYGHGVGDELLVQVGGRLSRAARQGDLVARLGGDEFVVLAEAVNGSEGVMGLALRFTQAFEPPIPAGGVEHRIGVAIGVSLTPDDGADAVELVRKADIALYRAKAEKKAEPRAIRFFEPAMDERIRERNALERELRLAVERGEVRPFYQPLVRIADGAIEGFEALARWTSQTLGVVSPARFIPLAEDTGLIGPLSVALFEQACRDALDWPPSVHLAFNVSGALLQSDQFALQVLATLGRTGLTPSRVELEITETAMVRDLEGARRLLGLLRQSGVRIALDDFGTGYSSLYHLRAFTPDKIKIDRSFVDGMQDDASSTAIIRALVGLGVGLGAQVIAEGVETGEQERLLQQLGCEQGQGYLFSAAVEASAAAAMVDEGRGGATDRMAGAVGR